MEVLDKIKEDKKSEDEDIGIETLRQQSGIEEASTVIAESLVEQGSNSNRVRNTENETCEADSISKKAATAKLKFRKLKQRLTNMCYKHEDFATGKEVTSTNKPRIMKLSIELQKQVNNQVKDYNNIQAVMKQLLKILQQKRENDVYHKRQNDLHILRQSKCIPSLMQFCKKLLSLYKNEFRQSYRLIEIVNRILLIFSTVGINRQYLLRTNRIPTLTSLLITLIKKQQTTDLFLISNLYNLLTSLLDHKLQDQYGPLIQQTVQYLHQCSIIKKTVTLIETLIEDGSITNQHLVKSSFKFLACVFKHTDHLCEIRPIQQINITTQSQSCLSNIELILTFLNQYSQLVIPDKQSIQRTLLDGDLPASSISILLLITQTLYLCCKLNLELTQKVIGDQILIMLAFALRYSKQFSKQSKDLQQLLNRAIMLIGYLAFLNNQLQGRINKCHIITDLCSLPTNFLIDKKLVQVLMPTLCCLLLHNQDNIKSVQAYMSPKLITIFLETEMKLQSNQQKSIGSTPGLLTRKSSLSSMTSAITQCSSIISHNQKGQSIFSLRIRFPFQYWKELYDRLNRSQ